MIIYGNHAGRKRPYTHARTHVRTSGNDKNISACLTDLFSFIRVSSVNSHDSLERGKKS